MKKSKKKKRKRVVKNLDRLRTILISGRIDKSLASRVIEKLLVFNAISHKKPITLVINSGGGSVFDGLAIIDTMRTTLAPVRTVILGEASSMAGIISIAGDERIITKNSYWMGHPLAGGSRDYISFVKDRVDFYNELYNKVLAILRKRTKLTRDDIRKIERGELWLDAIQTLKKGIVDKVI